MFKHLCGNYVGKLLLMAADRLSPESPGLLELKPKYDFSPTKTSEAVKEKAMAVIHFLIVRKEEIVS